MKGYVVVALLGFTVGCVAENARVLRERSLRRKDGVTTQTIVFNAKPDWETVGLLSGYDIRIDH